MSELKAFNCVDSDLQEFCEPRLVYLKSEADKVIAELEESHKKEVGQLLIEIAELKENHKTEVKELLCLIRDKENNFNRAFDSEEKEIRHQKQKRCLAMANWCWAIKEFNIQSGELDYAEFAEKWRKRWLSLADKFKEAK